MNTAKELQQQQCILFHQNMTTLFRGEVVVKFGLQNFGVSPAGLNVNGTGHHHLIIDADLPNLTQPIQADKNHVHFGKGQTEVQLELEPGLILCNFCLEIIGIFPQPTDLLKQNYSLL